MGSKTITAIVTLVVLSLLFIVGNVVHQFTQSDYVTETAMLTTVDDAISIDALFVRDESVIYMDSSGGVISYKVNDADKLGDGSVIAEVYQTEDEANIDSKIEALEEKIALLELVQNPGTSLSAQPSNISEKITGIYRTMMHDRQRNDISAIVDEKNSLLTLFSTYQILTDDTVDFVDTIDSLNAEIAKLKAEKTEPMETIKADGASYFISYSDGFEDTISTEILDTITVDEINSVVDNGAIEDSTIVGKTVDGYKWYVVGVVSDRIGELTTDESVTVKFSSTDKTASAEVESIRNTDDGEQIVVVSSEIFEKEFVQHRREKLQIVKGTYTGIKVPRSAIRFADVEVTETSEDGEEYTETENVRGVYILNGSEAEFRQLDIIFENDDYVISSVDAGDGYLSLYDSIITEGAEGQTEASQTEEMD